MIYLQYAPILSSSKRFECIEISTSSTDVQHSSFALGGFFLKEAILLRYFHKNYLMKAAPWN